MFKYGKTKQGYHMIIFKSFSGLCWLAFFFIFGLCSAGISTSKRCRQAGGTCLFSLSWLQLAGGECCTVMQAVSCAGRGEPQAWGDRERHNAGEPVADWKHRDCQGEQGANSLVLRMLKRKTFCKDIEGTAKSLLQFTHPEEASGLRARLEQSMCLQRQSGTGVG